MKFEEFPIWKWLNSLFKYISICSSLLFYICLCFLFLSRERVLKITTKFCILISILLNIFQIVFALLYSLLVMLNGDIEVNPEPKKKDKDFLWNLIVSAYAYSKLFLLNSFNLLHKFDAICLSETYLDSNTPLDDENLEISGFTLVCSDYPSNTKRGGVSLYCKNNLPVRVKYRLFK